MTPLRTARHPQSSFWLPVLAGLPLAACLLAMALPILGHGSATWSRTLYLSAFALWILPLTALQRWLWSRGTSAWRMVPALLVATYAMALATRLLVVVLPGLLSGDVMKNAVLGAVDAARLFRGLEGAWLVLVAYCAIHAVVTYYDALRREQARHLEAQAFARDAELRALRYQLQPHFLFNSLNAISTLVVEGRSTEARQMLARLGDFLRTVLEARPNHEVTLAEEVGMTEAYLEVEKARLGRRLQLSLRLGSGVLGAYVPYLLLQPLVENAIRHGIAQRRVPGRLDICIARDDSQLRIRICNDLAEIDEVPPPMADTREAVGLDNVRGRLQRLYLGEAELEARIIDGRYEVQVALPLRLQADGGA